MSENIVGDWLCTLCLSEYVEGFLDNGYDDLEICKQIGEPDLDAIGVTDSTHRSQILRAVKTLREHGATAVYFTVEEAAAAAHQIKTNTCQSKPNYSTYMYDDELPPPQSLVKTGSDSPADVDEAPIYLRKYLDEYEEGKAELVKIPRLQLKGLVRDKLARDGVRLCSPPYSNADGSKGYLDGLAVTYAETFKTHYQDVVEHLETLRRKEIEAAMTCHVKLAQESCSNIYGTVAPSSLHSSPIYKPGKYLPSSCLSDQDEEEIYGYGGYGIYGRRIYKHHANRLACLATPQRCLNPKSTGFYDTSHFSSSTSELQDPCDATRLPDTSFVKKKGGPLGRILRGLTLKKDKDRIKSTDKVTSTRHLIPTKSLPPRVPDHVSNTVLYSDGTYASRDVRATAEERMKLVLMVKEGQISMEEAFEKMCQYEPQRCCLTQDEVLKDFRHGFLNVGTKKSEMKETARFYTSVDGSYIQPTEKCQHWYDEPPYESDQDDGRRLGPMSLPNDATKMANGSCVRDLNVDTSSPPASWVYSGDSIMVTRTAGDIQVTTEQIRSKTEEKRKDGSRLSNLSSASSKRDSLDSLREDGGINSPVHTRKNKMLSKFRSITSRNHVINSASEEALSLSSDYEDQDHEDNKKMERRLSRDVSGRASAFVGRVRGFGNDVRKKISKLRPSRTVSESEASEPNANAEVNVATSASSVESIPSGSGSSVQALTTSSSNRSSTSVEEEVAAYSGPIIGRARALVDYTPSPYDKDALKFKKGDMIDIISMSQTGSWTGMFNNRVGHFKFINVEIVPEPKPRPRRSNLPKRRNSKRGKPKSVEELLHRINLEEHISVFVLNGYENLDLFKELDEEDLDYLGISIPEHRTKILTAVELLHDYDSPDCPEGEDEPATDGESSTEQVDGNKQGNDELERLQQSPRDSGCYASNENLSHRDSNSGTKGTSQSDKSKDYSFSSAVANNLDCELSLRTRDKCCTRNRVTKAVIEAVPKHDFQPNILSAVATDVEIKSMDDYDLGLSRQSPLDTQGAITVIQREPTTANSRSRSLEKTNLVLPTKNKTEINHRPNSLVQLPQKCSTLPRKLRLGNTNKKVLLKEQSADVKAPTVEAENLQVILVRKLADDSIDLTQEPYTDKTGFCGIPAALVQRYAEEMKHDIKEIANCLDCIRLQQLQQRGRQGVPNDFLADACSMYETNYSSLSAWLLSLGLPMYTDSLIQAGHSQLSDVVCLKECDLCFCGVSEPTHLRRLLIEIDALNIHLQKFAC